MTSLLFELRLNGLFDFHSALIYLLSYNMVSANEEIIHILYDSSVLRHQTNVSPFDLSNVIRRPWFLRRLLVSIALRCIEYLN